MRCCIRRAPRQNRTAAPCGTLSRRSSHEEADLSSLGVVQRYVSLKGRRISNALKGRRISNALKGRRISNAM